MRIRKDRKHLYDSIDEALKGNEDGDYVPRDFADWQGIPYESLHQCPTLRGIEKGLDWFSPKYRQVVILREIEHQATKKPYKCWESSEAAVDPSATCQAHPCAITRAWI